MAFLILSYYTVKNIYFTGQLDHWKKTIYGPKHGHFKSEIGLIDLDNIFEVGRNVNNNFHSFIGVLTRTLDQCLPKLQIKYKNQYRKTWLTKGIKISCRHKRLLKSFISFSVLSQFHLGVIIAFKKNIIRNMKKK